MAQSRVSVLYQDLMHQKEHNVENSDMTEWGVGSGEAYSHLSNDPQNVFSPSEKLEAYLMDNIYKFRRIKYTEKLYVSQ